MIQTTIVKQKRRNQFMTDEEAIILWRYSKRWGSKWQAMVALALFRGLRIGEICAMNLYDFKDDGFRKFEVVFQKSHVHDELPLMEEVSTVLQEYVRRNVHRFKDGYLFGGRKGPFLTVPAACAMFCKMRNTIARDHPSFADHALVNGVKRHRISWHTCRRWFETKFWEEYKDVYALRDLMRYSDTKSIQPYIDSYQLWKEETERLQKAFNSVLKDCSLQGVGQSSLGGYL